jgi:8-oxo-dGTP diphosphatase
VGADVVDDAIDAPVVLTPTPARHRAGATEILVRDACLITLVTSMSERAVVRAAGGVIVRQTGDQEPEILLIHRSRHDDWTLPKGKLEPGESYQACALREVAEETGLRCLLGDELPQTSHVDRKGRLKIVRYFVMRPIVGEPEARDDVDLVRWLPVARALRLLSYDYDRALLRASASVLLGDREAPRRARRASL